MEAEKVADTKAHGGRRKHCTVGKLRQAYIPGTQTASILHRVRMDIWGEMNVRVLRAPQSNIHKRECWEVCKAYKPSLADRMHGTGNGGLGRFFWPVCILIAVMAF